MRISQRIASGVLAGALGLTMLPTAASADGAASTRNILLGGAAAAAGALLIVNHNKKVHQKYAEYDQRQAQTQAAADRTEAAYESEKQAYAHEAALASDYRKEVAYQHAAVRERDARIASLIRSLRIAKAANRPQSSTAFVRPAVVPAVVPAVAFQQRVARATPSALARAAAPQSVSYGWGTY